MRKILVIISVTIVLIGCNNERVNTNVKLESDIDSVSYAIGAGQAKSLLYQVPNLNLDAFFRAYLDVADSLELKIDGKTSGVILQAYSIKVQREKALKQLKALEEKYADVKNNGEKFLEENKTKPGVDVTSSGLQYVVIKEGIGKQPEGPTASVTVNYKGTTPEGIEFDAKDNSTFKLNAVIKGWTEGLQLMKEGAKYKFFVPQELAYGTNPRGKVIKPFMPLVFEIELISVN